MHLLERANRMDGRDIFVISEESKSYYPSDNGTGNSSPNIKTQDLQEEISDRAKIYEFKINPSLAVKF